MHVQLTLNISPFLSLSLPLPLSPSLSPPPSLPLPLLRLFCGTWNVNGQHPMQRMDKWLMSRLPLPDIFAIG